tara:strand:- start:333 stop:572 length:240 start_codon:yes stop_codon:yes gene_type:complete
MQDRSKIFGQNLHWLIAVSGKGMREFSREHGISYSLLKKYTAGSVLPRHNRVVYLSNVLGVSPGSMLFDDLVPDIEEAV